jgi:K+-transporting ATPase A subunit
MGVNPQERMGWQRYGAALVLSNALMMLLGYLLLRLQGAAAEPAGDCGAGARPGLQHRSLLHHQYQLAGLLG